MALLGAVVFRQDQPQCLTCRTCGGTRCALCGNGGGGVDVAGEFGRIERGVVVQQEQEEELVGVPRAGGLWAGMATCVGPVPSLTTSGRPLHVPASAGHVVAESEPAPARAVRKRRRKTSAAAMSAAEAESQRLNHIAVERNRRRQMNEYLAVLHSLMPPSYARRGDQASIVGGAINFVKELEHRLHSLQAQKRRASATIAAGHRQDHAPFAGFFTLPQYSTSAAADDDVSSSCGSESCRPSITRPGVADVEAAVSEGHATVKLLLPPRGRRPARRPRMLLLRLLLGLQRRGLAALHLNVTTTADEMALYTFSLSMGDGCQLSSAGDVAAAVHDMVADMSTADLELAAY